MRGYASTVERLSMMAGFYQDLFEEIGQPHTLLGPGCGLNLFALPWMGLDRAARYVAYDIDHRLICAGAQVPLFGAAGEGGRADYVVVSVPARTLR